MVLFCCGVPLCVRWWCGPDIDFDGVCDDIFFFFVVDPYVLSWKHECWFFLWWWS